jgi:hypothetical protein
MKKNLTLFLLFAIPFLCMAQKTLPREYLYDIVGNRTIRKVLETGPLDALPPPPQDSLPPLTSPPPLPSLETLSSLETTPEETNYFVETLAQTQIKIYPNPTTEKVTMEISGWETLQTGVFKLYSLTGQLLQEQPVHSLNTTISLAGLSKGSYILKVIINDYYEDWKIIKQ